MNINHTTKRDYFTILDYFPGGSAALLCKGLSIGFHGTPLMSALVTGLYVTLGFAVGFTLSVFLRMQLRKVIQNRVGFVLLSLMISLSLSTAFITGAALEPFGSQSHREENRVPPIPDTSINVSTFMQGANGTTDNDITTDEVGRWASYLLEQSRQPAKQTCLEKGGDENTCSQIKFEETHRVIQSSGRTIAIIQFRSYLGSTTYGRAVRVVGIKGPDIVSVTCVRDGIDLPLAPTMSPCAEQIKKDLGFTFPEQ